MFLYPQCVLVIPTVVDQAEGFGINHPAPGTSIVACASSTCPDTIARPENSGDLTLQDSPTAQHLLTDAAESPPGYPPILSAEVAANEDRSSPPGSSSVAGGSCTDHASPPCPDTVARPENAGDLTLQDSPTAQHLLIDAAESPPGYPPILSAEVAVNEDGLSPPGPSPVAGGSCTCHASPSCPGTVGSPENDDSQESQPPQHHVTYCMLQHLYLATTPSSLHSVPLTNMSRLILWLQIHPRLHCRQRLLLVCLRYQIVMMGTASHPLRCLLNYSCY